MRVLGITQRETKLGNFGSEEVLSNQCKSMNLLRPRNGDMGNVDDNTEGGLGFDCGKEIHSNTLGRKSYLHHAQDKALKEIEQGEYK
jgi:hypothetical protein